MAGAVLIAVGDELLAGSITDTNSPWLARALRQAGFPVSAQEAVGDDPSAIAAAVRRALEGARVVLVSGGLGPTRDDLTRDGVARAFGLPLEESLAARAAIEAFFAAGGRSFEARDHVQAMLPRGAELLPNPRGTAPGFLLRPEGRLVAVLPGVPHELREMFRAEVLPELARRADADPPPRVRVLTVVGLTESVVGERLGDLMARGRNPILGSYPGTARIVLRFEARGLAPEAADALLERDLATVRARLGDAVLGEGDLALHAVVAEELLRQGITLATAESLTGGRIADLLVQVPGISPVYPGGVIAYADAMKVRWLGVREPTLREHGAVSEACAGEMARGVLEATGADWGLATTGIAGPTGAVPGKPVGTVFLALATPEETVVEHHRILGDRHQVRERSAARALDLLRRRLTTRQGLEP